MGRSGKSAPNIYEEFNWVPGQWWGLERQASVLEDDPWQDPVPYTTHSLVEVLVPAPHVTLQWPQWLHCFQCAICKCYQKKINNYDNQGCFFSFYISCDSFKFKNIYWIFWKEKYWTCIFTCSKLTPADMWVDIVTIDLPVRWCMVVVLAVSVWWTQWSKRDCEVEIEKCITTKSKYFIFFLNSKILYNTKTVDFYQYQIESRYRLV